MMTLLCAELIMTFKVQSHCQFTQYENGLIPLDVI